MPTAETLARYRARTNEELDALTPETKTCRTCQEVKPGDQFARDRSKPDGRDTRCKACAASAMLAYRRAQPERVRASQQRSYHKTYPTAREYRLRKLFGLTRSEFESMRDAQGGCCAVCKQPETAAGRDGQVRDLSVDHCHATGQVRGLLCMACNSGLGYFRDDPDRLQAAIAYLAHHSSLRGQKE